MARKYGPNYQEDKRLVTGTRKKVILLPDAERQISKEGILVT